MQEIRSLERHIAVTVTAPAGDVVRVSLMLGLPVSLAAALAFFLLYGVPATPGLPVAAFLSILFYTCIGGFILQYEYRVMTTPGVNSRLPLFALAGYLVLIVVIILMYRVEPRFIGLARMLEFSVVTPLLVLLVVTAVFSIAYRLLFIRILNVITHVDYLHIFGRGRFMDRIETHWDSATEFGEPLAVAVAKVQTPAKKRKAGRKPDPAYPVLTAVADRMLVTAENNIRKSDKCERYARDAIWLLLYRTAGSQAEIPIRRLLEYFKADQDLQDKLANISGQIRVGIGSVENFMKKPEDLEALAREALDKAIESNLPYLSLPEVASSKSTRTGIESLRILIREETDTEDPEADLNVPLRAPLSGETD